MAVAPRALLRPRLRPLRLRRRPAVPPYVGLVGRRASAQALVGGHGRRWRCSCPATPTAAPTSPGALLAGRRQRRRHRLPLPRASPAAGWASWPRSPPSAPRWCRCWSASPPASGPALLVWVGIVAALPGDLAGRPAAPTTRCDGRRAAASRSRPAWSTGCWPGSASACCSRPWARCRTAPGWWPLTLSQAVERPGRWCCSRRPCAPSWVPRGRPVAAARLLCGPLGAAGDRLLPAGHPARATSPSRACWPRSTPRARCCWRPWCCTRDVHRAQGVGLGAVRASRSRCVAAG